MPRFLSRLTIARRDLHHAEPVAVRVQPQRLGVDGHSIDIVAGQVWQIVFVEADIAHCLLRIAVTVVLAAIR
jgi:hypothetical protein